MGYEYHGVLVVGKDVAQQAALRLSIKSRRSLIKHHYLSIAQQCTRYGYALSLTFGQSPTLLSTASVETIGHSEHKISTTLAQDFAHFLLGCVALTKSQVVAYGAAHERVALRHIHKQRINGDNLSSSSAL